MHIGDSSPLSSVVDFGELTIREKVVRNLQCPEEILDIGDFRLLSL